VGEPVVNIDPVVRPDPVLTWDNAGFWDAAADHRLVAQRCSSCRALRHPPGPMCSRCRSLEWEWVDLSGRGVVYSYSILHHPQHPAFSYPVLAVLVDLEEGVRILSNLVDVDPVDVAIGLPVEVRFATTNGRRSVPVFARRAAES
jgi:uncharacterized OB-fold protein